MLYFEKIYMDDRKDSLYMSDSEVRLYGPCDKETKEFKNNTIVGNNKVMINITYNKSDLTYFNLNVNFMGNGEDNILLHKTKNTPIQINKPIATTDDLINEAIMYVKSIFNLEVI